MRVRRIVMSLSIIHLSDIHINNGNDAIFKKINELQLACVSSLPSNGVVVVIVSGDIAYSGKDEQYSLAKRMLDNLSEYISAQKSSTVHVICVPGNHDCDFTTESSIRKALIPQIHSDSIDTDFYNTVLSVQKSYYSFAESLGIDMSLILPRLEVSFDDHKALFLLVNSAWMSTLHETPGKNVMPYHLYEEVSLDNYAAVICVFHHPINWLNPDFKRGFIEFVRQNSDIILSGHEHELDRYEKSSNYFSFFCSQGKELQDNNNDSSSAFSVLNFDRNFNSISVVDYSWRDHHYERANEALIPYHKNKAAKKRTCSPNARALKQANDIGMVINHFAKEDVVLQDLFVWPDLSKNDFCNENEGSLVIRDSVEEELLNNSLNILVGASFSGKTAICQELFLLEESSDSCCLLLHGSQFITTDEPCLLSVIEATYSQQYSVDHLEDFRQLPKEQRIVIVDDFDSIKNIKGRRSTVLDFLCGYFGRVTILLSTNLELATIVPSNTIRAQEHFIYYEILPLGNKKRQLMISKWYRLNEYSRTDDEITARIDDAIGKVNIFLGSENAFIPAAPIFIISALQNIDGIQSNYSGSKYGFLYESLITSSLARVSQYAHAGNYEIDTGIMSTLSYRMLLQKKTFFSFEDLQAIVSEAEAENLLTLSTKEILGRMIESRIVIRDRSIGDVYRFTYPYAFYYFCGRYIAYNLNRPDVQSTVDYMSARLYNETYGNIVIFLCHFGSNSDVIDSVLLTAYDTLQNYETFDFNKSNPIFEDIKDVMEMLIPRVVASSDMDVIRNKDAQFERMDKAGIHDGQVKIREDTIVDEISEKEHDMAAIVAGLKTIEVLGEILQNYPLRINAQKKIEIINEIHNLGMRSVQAIISTMGFLEDDLVEYLYTHAISRHKTVSKDEIVLATRRFIHILISGVARGMIHQIATALNNEHLLLAAERTLENDNSVSSNLVLLDLKLNCLNRVSYADVKSLKKSLDSNSEKYASKIVDSIVGYYLNYNSCDHALRAKLCSLCGLSQQLALIESTKNLLAQ